MGECKIFVGGLSWETTSHDLQHYFTKFGDVIDCKLPTDPNTGRSRGFGFVQFSDDASVDKVLSHASHVLDGRSIDPKRAKPRGDSGGGGGGGWGGGRGGGGGGDGGKKIFVGGIDPNTSEDDIREYFEKFGRIEEISLPYDRERGHRKAFGFIEFESDDSANGACDQMKQWVGGKEVTVKKATPKSDRGGGGGWRGGSSGGGGGDWGGDGGYGGGGSYGGYGGSGGGGRSYGGGSYGGGGGAGGGYGGGGGGAAYGGGGGYDYGGY